MAWLLGVEVELQKTRYCWYHICNLHLIHFTFNHNLIKYIRSCIIDFQVGQAKGIIEGQWFQIWMLWSLWNLNSNVPSCKKSPQIPRILPAKMFLAALIINTPYNWLNPMNSKFIPGISSKPIKGLLLLRLPHCTRALPHYTRALPHLHTSFRKCSIPLCTSFY